MGNIENFFFETDRGKIFCVIVGDCAVSSKSCVIYFAPLFEERMWVQRIALNFALQLWDRDQIPTLFFDYYGYGESDGEHEEFTLQHCHDDVRELLGFLREKRGVNQFIFWGIRAGCVIALSFLHQYHADPISKVILWAPILDLKGYVYQALMGTMAGQFLLFKKPLAKRNEIIEETLRDGACLREGFALNNIESYRFGREFYLEIQQITPKELIAAIRDEALILEVVQVGKVKRQKTNDEVGEPDHPGTGKIENLIVNAPEFWLNRQDYSQCAEEIYRIAMEWIKEFCMEEKSQSTLSSSQ